MHRFSSNPQSSPSSLPSSFIHSRSNPMSTLKVADFIGRMLMALLFILAAVGKATNSGPALAHMAAHGVPAFVLPAVIALQLAARLALLAGWRGHWAAAALGVVSLARAFVFARAIGKPAQATR